MAETKLQAVRLHLGMKADAVIEQMIARAEMLGMTIMSRPSLKTNLSKWENGHKKVTDARYRRLFREIYGRQNEELGFPPGEEADPEISELRSRIQIASSIDAGTVQAVRQQIDAMRYPDRKLGGATLLEELRNIIARADELLRYSTASANSAPLAGALTEASTLAGWLALSRNAVGQAWMHYERATDAARRSESVPLLTHALAEQAFVLIDLGETTMAVEQLEHARTIADHRVSPLLGAWLAAAQGEGLAATGQRDAALRAFEDASGLLPANSADPELPFIFLGEQHLARWRGNALVRTGDAESLDALSNALDQLPPDFGRARVGMLVDLAFAHAATGDRRAAQYYQRQARQLGRQLSADRHLRRLAGLVLPTP